MASRDWTALIMASMSANENSALRREASAATVAEDDYQSFCQALGASARGRAFLQEYARRNRHADTEVVLEALNRLEETARTQKPAGDGDRIRQDLRALLDTLRTAKPQTENSPSAIKAATIGTNSASASGARCSAGGRRSIVAMKRAFAASRPARHPLAGVFETI